MMKGRSFDLSSPHIAATTPSVAAFFGVSVPCVPLKMNNAHNIIFVLTRKMHLQKIQRLHVPDNCYWGHRNSGI